MLAKAVAGMALVALVMSLVLTAQSGLPSASTLSEQTGLAPRTQAAPPARSDAAQMLVSPPPPAPPAPSPEVVAPLRSAADPLPTSLPALLDLLATYREEVRELIDRGQLGAIYVPALAAKDVALALEDHAGGLTDRELVRATAAVRRVVLEAWNLDAYGDRGDLEPVIRAFTALDAATVELKDVHEAGR